jgi:aspartyl protease family protein
LAFLVTALISRKDVKFSQIIKYGGAWIGIIILFLGLYSYRFEFGDIKNRIIGEINPSKARINQSGQVVIKLAKDGHYYMDIKINNVPIKFMVDTGASSVVLGKDEAKRVGINIDELNFNKSYQTANGVIFAAAAVIDKVEFAGLNFQNLPVSINSANMGAPLLGMSFLRKFKKYEFYRDRLILTL